MVDFFPRVMAYECAREEKSRGSSSVVGVLLNEQAVQKRIVICVDTVAK
jgi:hypothetical protein